MKLTKPSNLRPQDCIVYIDNVDLAYANTPVLKAVSMGLVKGDIGAIVGPSGSGKSSLLRAIAGFMSVQAGNIYINQNLVASSNEIIPPALRSVGLVFQDFALFPHLTVQQNIEYGLSKLPEQERHRRALYYMQLTGIADFASAYPADLSGGQQQRVAIARAIAPEPNLLLMDEAFSSLDPTLREQVASDIRSIIKQLGLTAILVTHDQTEAFAFADKIAVVAQGKLQQFSTAYDLYHQPETYFVANFIGEGAFIEANIAKLDDNFVCTSALGTIELTRFSHFDPTKNTIKLLLRPDDVIHDDESSCKAIIESKQFRGAYIRYQLRLPSSNENVLCFAPSHHNHEIGEQFGIRADIAHLIYF